MTTAIPLPASKPRRGPGRRVVRWVALLVLLAIMATVVGVLLVAFRVWWVARQDERPRSDVIVVLGASQYDGTPSPVLQARLDHAKALYDDGVAPTIVTVGGKLAGDRFTEAAAGKAWLVKEGVPAADIVAVGEGSDTWLSLEAVEAVMADKGWDSAVIVTDPWHSFRSREMARHLGMDVATSPTRSGPVVAERLTEERYVARETGAYLAFLWQRLNGTLPSDP